MQRRIDRMNSLVTEKTGTDVKVIAIPQIRKGFLLKEKGKKMVRTCMSIVFTLYGIAMFFVFPLYMGDGYYMMTDYKFRLFKQVTIPFLLLQSILILVDKILSGKSTVMKKRKLQMSGLFLILYGADIVISTKLSLHPETALYGFKDWYMGMYLLLGMLFLYCIYALYDEGHEVLFLLYFLSGTLMAFFGYMQRLGFNFLSDQGYVQGNENLSTMGNINWICGYLAVYLPVLSFACMEARVKWQKYFYAILVVINFGFLALQGSEGGYLILLMILYGYFLYACFQKKKDGLIRYFWFAGFVFLGIWISGKLYFIQRDRGVYEYSSLNWIVKSNLWLVVSIVCFGIMVLLMKNPYGKKIHRKRIGKAFFQISLVCVILFAVCYVLHAINWNTLSFLTKYGIFRFDYSWGHNRGIIWRMAAVTFGQELLRNKLFGLGPDCFYYGVWSYSFSAFPSAEGFLQANPILTNAHNVYLTILINLGIVGLVAYLGFLLSLLAEFGKAFQKGCREAFIGIVIILSVMCYQMISFEQPMATPFLFIMLGILKHKTRKGTKNPGTRQRLRGSEKNKTT